MDDPVKMRYELIRIYAELDTEHQRLLQEAQEADALLARLSQDLPEESAATLRSVIHAYRAVDRHLTQLACTHLVIRAEVELNYRQNGHLLISWLTSPFSSHHPKIFLFFQLLY